MTMSAKSIGLAALFGLFGLVLQRQVSCSGDPISFMIPNLLLFTPFRGLTMVLWQHLIQYDMDSGKKDPMPIPEIGAKEYNYEYLREVTDNFRSPAVIRGLFLGAPALTQWPQLGYLSSQALGDMVIPVISNNTLGTHKRKERIDMTFREAAEEVLQDENSVKYIFFPVKSPGRVETVQANANKNLTDETNRIIREDLELHRIFPGYGTESHKKFYGGQMIIGRGKEEESRAPTGSGWHCAPGNNWFVQVHGRKRWYFLDPKYSAYLQPIRNGVVTMQTSTPKMREYMQYLPVQYVDLQPGDVLYNPDWQWHLIQNYEGLSIGVPLREVDFKVAFRNNFQYTVIVLVNKFFEKLGIIYGFEEFQKVDRTAAAAS